MVRRRRTHSHLSVRLLTVQDQWAFDSWAERFINYYNIKAARTD